MRACSDSCLGMNRRSGRAIRGPPSHTSHPLLLTSPEASHPSLPQSLAFPLPTVPPQGAAHHSPPPTHPEKSKADSGARGAPAGEQPRGRKLNVPVSAREKPDLTTGLQTRRSAPLKAAWLLRAWLLGVIIGHRAGGRALGGTARPGLQEPPQQLKHP